MKKLISKNPIELFKIGKFQKGNPLLTPIKEETIGSYKREKNRSLFGSGYRWYNTNLPVGLEHVPIEEEIRVGNWILKPDGSKVWTTNRNKTRLASKSANKPTTKITNNRISSPTNTPIKETTTSIPVKTPSLTVSAQPRTSKSTISVQPKTSNKVASVKTPNPTANVQSRTSNKIKVSSGTSSPVTSAQPRISNKAFSGASKFMGTGVQKGWTSNYGNNLWNGITNDLKLALIGTGKFTEDSFKDARSLQTALNNYFAGNAATMNNQDTTASRIAVDNKWGDLSQKALMHALSMANYDEARPLNINNVSPINAPLNGISTIPTKAEARPEHIYNRAEVRQLLRNQGINPYSLSGALRQAIRFALNGGHKYNKALLHGINLKKLTLPTTVPNTTPNSGNVQTNAKENTILMGYNPLEVANPGIITLKKSGGRLISKSPVELFIMRQYKQ